MIDRLILMIIDGFFFPFLLLFFAEGKGRGNGNTRTRFSHIRGERKKEKKKMVRNERLVDLSSLSQPKKASELTNLVDNYET